MTNKLTDCCSSGAGELMSHDEANALLKERTGPVAGREIIALDGAAGRVLAASVIAPRPVPAHDNSAMDGYAFAHESLAGEPLPVTGRVSAGHPLGRVLGAGEAVRIFTGAVVPEGADTVVMQEHVSVSDEHVSIPPGLKKGANVRSAGEDVAEGAELVSAGVRLRAQDIAAIASAGAGEVECFKRLKVALVSSGDEIIRPGQAFREGAVYDSNSFLLRALLASLPVDITDLGILADDFETVRDALAQAASTHDLILTSGGTSVGEEDHMSAAVTALGSLDMWRLAIKPGKPLSFGKIGDAVFAGLPGNPVAAAVTFSIYARPMLLAMAGAGWREARRFMLPSAFELKARKTGRREFLRGVLAGSWVDRYSRDGSGLISSLRESDGLIELPEDLAAVKKGDLLAFIPYSELGICV